MSYQYIQTESVPGERLGVGVIRLDRPKQLNALNEDLMDELGAALLAFDNDDRIGCIVLTGNEKAFAAGADIHAMVEASYTEMVKKRYITRNWETILQVRKPVIAAVAGYALGGGCELAMMCDIIIAADSARFGLPEIRIGVMPGAGGTQRLPRAIGKAKAMDMILSGQPMTAAEAEAAGLVSRVVPAAELMERTLGLARELCKYSQPSLHAAKQAVNRVYEMPLREGVLFERTQLYALFATADQKEGMRAFVEKRPPEFRDE
jgi:enoyl-CoA hydratase